VPDKSSYTIVIHTNRMERVFVFAREDHVAPSMTQELTWDAVVAHGCVYGLAYDDWYGTGVSQVRLAVTDAGTRWLSDKETWQNQETWFAPQHILPLNEFLESHLEDKLLERLPEEIRQELRSKVENIPCQLNHEYQPRIWLHCFKDLSLLGGDMKVVRGRVIDHAGNHSLMESVDIRMTADFEAEPVAALLALKFRDRSQGFVVECHWDFGDGHTSAKANPTHKYAAPGTYKVSLTICGPYASDHVVREISVRRTEQAPK
jgi:hypothetical protein